MIPVKTHFRESIKKLKQLDKNVTIIFLIVASLNIISYYLTSRRFFRTQLQSYFFESDYLNLFEFLYWFFGDFLNFTLLPLLAVIFFHKKKFSDFGLTFGDKKLGLKVSGIVLAIAIPILWVVSSFESFSNFYPHLHLAKTNFQIFLIYEIGMLFYMFGWEFIWRGYMLFGLEEKFDWYAIYIQMIPFVILHNGKPVIETIGSILAAIALGVLAFRTRSFLYGVLIHFIIMFCIDFFGFIRFQLHYFNIIF